MALYEVVMTADGNIVTDPRLLKRFNVSATISSFYDLEKAEELSVILLPFISGGHAMFTITGPPGDFLKIPIEFSLVSKRVKNNVCYLRLERLKANG